MKACRKGNETDCSQESGRSMTGGSVSRSGGGGIRTCSGGRDGQGCTASCARAASHVRRLCRAVTGQNMTSSIITGSVKHACL